MFLLIASLAGCASVSAEAHRPLLTVPRASPAAYQLNRLFTAWHPETGGANWSESELRPEEAISLTADNVILPPQVRNRDSRQAHDLPEDEGRGELHIRTATPDAGSEWTDDESPRDRRQLKHRAEGDSRIVPVHPELARLLRDHLAHFGIAPDGRLSTSVRPGDLSAEGWSSAGRDTCRECLLLARVLGPGYAG